jgi:hypothetical protein
MKYVEYWRLRQGKNHREVCLRKVFRNTHVKNREVDAELGIILRWIMGIIYRFWFRELGGNHTLLYE